MAEIQVTVEELIEASQEVIRRLQAENSRLTTMNIIFSGRLIAMEAEQLKASQNGTSAPEPQETNTLKVP